MRKTKRKITPLWWPSLLLLAVFMAGCDSTEKDPILGGNGAGSTSPLDTTAPMITAVSGPNGSTGLAINSDITATFNELMDASSLVSASPSTNSTFTVCDTGTVQGGACLSDVEGVVTYAGTTATFKPNATLASNTWYTSSISADAKDLAGNALSVPSLAGGLPNPWSWQTLAAADVTAPMITAVSAPDGSTGLAINRDITATFNELMDASSLVSASPSTSSTFTVCDTGTVQGGACLSYVEGVVTYAGTTVSFRPNAILASNTWYTSSISADAKDLAGNALSVPSQIGGLPNRWSWKTSLTVDVTLPIVDVIAPRINAVSAADGSTGVAINQDVTATFNELMNASSLVSLSPSTDPLTTTFTVCNTGTVQGGACLSYVEGVVTYAGTTASFRPNAILASNTWYTSSISADAKDLAGNALSVPSQIGGLPNPWSWQTLAAADVTAPRINAVSAADGSTGVAINQDVTVTFNELMDASSLVSASPSTNSTFKVCSTGSIRGGACVSSVAGVVTYTGMVASFNPDGNLEPNTWYTSSISTDAKDLAGNALPVPSLAGNLPNPWSWQTLAAADVTAPRINAVSAADGSTGLAINRDITATFNELMDASSLVSASPSTNSTFKVCSTGSIRGGACVSSVAGVVTYAGTTVSFRPNAILASNTWYTSSISADAKDLAGNALLVPSAAGGLPNPWSWQTLAAADVTAPRINAVSAVDGSTGVAINQDVTATFNELMDASSLVSASPSTNSTFKVCSTGSIRGGACVSSVAGVVTYTGMVASFNPDGNLEPNTWYTSSISTDAKDLAGNALPVPSLAGNLPNPWSWKTLAAADVTAPRLTFVSAPDGSTGVEVNKEVTAAFNELMDESSLVSLSPSTDPLTTTFTVCNTGAVQGGACLSYVEGVVTYSGMVLSFKPDFSLALDTWYTSSISTDAKDLAGNALPVPSLAGGLPNPWSWQTSAAVDNIAPVITATNPVDLETDVAINKTVNATFSEKISQATMITSNYTLVETATLASVSGSVSYDVQHHIASFVPLNDLEPDTEYTAEVSDVVVDLAGNALLVPAVFLPNNPWTFRTAAALVAPVPLAVNLRGAESFGIASQAGLTSTGITVVNGDVALYPLASCTDATGNAGASQTCLVKTYASPTGLTVNGSIYWAGDPFDNGGTANSVSNDLNLAWTEARDKVVTEGSVIGDELGGKTLTPGVYRNAALGLQAGGIVTMDALGDANAIFVFQVDSSFVDSGTLLLPSSVVLVNGAQARNIWFVTGLDITIGSGTTWHGNILAGRDATVLDGSTVTGRVLAGASGAGAFTLTGAASPSVTTIIVP